MKIIAITGDIGSGKSTVAAYLRTRGYPIVDWDEISRCVATEEEVLYLLRNTFGLSIVKTDGSLDRKALAALIFSNDAKRSQLDEIMHPYIQKRAYEEEEKKKKGSSAEFLFHEIPLLSSLPSTDHFDGVIHVKASPSLRLDRLIRRGMEREDAQKRIAAQLRSAPYHPREKNVYVLLNEGNEEKLKKNAEEVLSLLKKDRNPRNKGS